VLLVTGGNQERFFVVRLKCGWVSTNRWYNPEPFDFPAALYVEVQFGSVCSQDFFTILATRLSAVPQSSQTNAMRVETPVLGGALHGANHHYLGSSNESNRR